MRCVVTGATGFVGRALVADLQANGHVVTGVARRASSDDGCAVVAVDVADMDPTSAVFEGAEVVYHLAAKTHDLVEGPNAEAEYRRVNVEGTGRVIGAARAAGVRRVVFVSSVKAVDEHNEAAVDERQPARPETSYGRSKLEAERLVAAAGLDASIETVCLRFPLVYGPSQRGNLERMIATIARGRFPPPPDNGNRRSMLHLANAVQALRLAGSHQAAMGKTYFVTDARPYSTRGIFDAVRAALGRPPLRWSVPVWMFSGAAAVGDLGRRLSGRRVGFDSDALVKLLGSAEYDSSLIQEELGYAPTADLFHEIPSIVEAMRSRP